MSSWIIALNFTLFLVVLVLYIKSVDIVLPKKVYVSPTKNTKDIPSFFNKSVV